MNIDSITNGFVIDHIQAGKGMVLYELLGLDKVDCSVAIIKNVNSKKMGKKDIIKIDDEIPVDFAVLGFVDPDITINIIKNSVLVEKRTVEMPEILKNVIKCKNPRCITQTEQELDQAVKLVDKEKEIYRCVYCDKQV